MTPTPYAIFDRARDAWLAERYPHTVAYSVVVTAGKNGTSAQRHYHEYWDSVTNRVYVKPPVSDEQLDHPYKPSPGVNFMGWNIGGPRTGTGVKDFIGVPELAPNYSFGMISYTPPSQLTSAELVRQIRAEFHDPAPAKVAKLARQSGLKTIAMVSTSARVYRIRLVGVERDGSGRDYHLRLQPLRDPLEYRLRDLWIDTATYQTRRARIGGNFTDAATRQVPWLVRFRQVGNATYIASERCEKPIVGYHGLMYSHYGVRFGVPQRQALPPLSVYTSVSSPLTEP